MIRTRDPQIRKLKIKPQYGGDPVATPPVNIPSARALLEEKFLICQSVRWLRGEDLNL